MEQHCHKLEGFFWELEGNFIFWQLKYVFQRNGSSRALFRSSAAVFCVFQIFICSENPVQWQKSFSHMHIILNWVLHQWHCSAFCEWEQQRSCIVITFWQCFHAVGFIQDTPVSTHRCNCPSWSLFWSGNWTNPPGQSDVWWHWETTCRLP